MIISRPGSSALTFYLQYQSHHTDICEGGGIVCQCVINPDLHVLFLCIDCFPNLFVEEKNDILQVEYRNPSDVFHLK